MYASVQFGPHITLPDSLPFNHTVPFFSEYSSQPHGADAPQRRTAAVLIDHPPLAFHRGLEPKPLPSGKNERERLAVHCPHPETDARRIR